MRRLRLWTLFSLLVFVPTLAFGDASVRQDSCVTVTDSVKTTVTIWFSVINQSLPAAVCDLHFIPVPFPAGPGCTMIGCDHPAGWSCGLDPGGGASWFAVGPADCIPPGGPMSGGIKSGFNFVLDPDFCCYVVEFTDATGAVMLSQQECFCGGTVSVEEAPWGDVKKIYREDE